MSNFSATSATYPHEEKSEDNDEEDEDHPKVVDTDPTGRFERFEESLGKGAYKEVFKAFDQEEGVEVAWCQLRLNFSKKKDAEKIQREIEILQSLRCENIINFYASWLKKGPDGKERVFFVTELMTSGTLKQYIRKTKGQLKPKLLKSWARQILKGLNYLHTSVPPVIHRDLKCDNIFINGNNGQAKIGDLGLAIIKNKEHASSVLGTPEFMAPELYEEKYNEKVDIYAFGMCVLELVTKEYPYTECTNQAQIYRKVTTGIKPQALQKVKDAATLEFIELCLKYNPDERPSAAQLLQHEFLKEDCVIDQNTSSSSKERDVSPRPVTPGSPKSPGLQGTSILIQSGSLANVTSSSNTIIDNKFNEENQGSTSKPNSILSVSKNLLPPPVTTTTKTIDAESKTYHVSSSNSTQLSRHGYKETSTPQQLGLNSSSAEKIPKPSPIECNIRIYQPSEKDKQSKKSKQAKNEVQLAMTIISPGRTDVEIKFPFNLEDDTPEDVVSEMVREQILVQEGHDLAKKNIEDIVNLILSGKHPLQPRTPDQFEPEQSKSRSSSRQEKSHPEQQIYENSHETDNELAHQANQGARLNEDFDAGFQSEISSSYDSMDVPRSVFHKDPLSSAESLTRASSARTSWERDADNEVRLVLHNSRHTNDSVTVNTNIMPTPEYGKTPPMGAIGIAPNNVYPPRSRSVSMSGMVNQTHSPPSSRSGTTTPFQWPLDDILPVDDAQNFNMVLNPRSPTQPSYSRPSSVASDSATLYHPQFSHPHPIKTNQNPSQSHYAATPDTQYTSDAPYVPASPRTNYTRSNSFSTPHSPGTSPLKLQDTQRRITNPGLPSSPIQPDIPINSINGYSGYSNNSERIRRSSISSTTSHSSAHSAIPETGSEPMAGNRSQIFHHTNMSQQQQLSNMLQHSQHMQQEEIVMNHDVGAGLGIQTEQGYLPGYRPGDSIPTMRGYEIGVSSNASSTILSPGDNYGLQDSQQRHNNLFPRSTPITENAIMYQDSERGGMHYSHPHQHHEFGPSSTERFPEDEDTSDDDEAVTLALKEKHRLETAELHQKHAQEWVQLMNERKMKYKHHHHNQSKSGNTNVAKSPGSSPKINRPPTTDPSARQNGVSSLNSTPALGPQTMVSDHYGNIPMTYSMIHASQLSVSSINPNSSAPKTAIASNNPAGINGGQIPVSLVQYNVASMSQASSVPGGGSSKPSIPIKIQSSATTTTFNTHSSIPNTILPFSTAIQSTQSSSSTSSSISLPSSMTTIPSASAPTSSHSINTSASAPTSGTPNTPKMKPQPGIAPSTIRSLPDELNAMTELQITELQKLAQKVNGQAKQSGSLANGTTNPAVSKVQAGRESPADGTSRPILLSQSLPHQQQFHASSMAQLSLYEMEKQQRQLSNHDLTTKSSALPNPLYPNVIHNATGGLGLNEVTSPFMPGNNGYFGSHQSNVSLDLLASFGDSLGPTLPSKKHQNEQDLLG
ncbi:hypothetical protein G9A89_005592 [Geosiphon pyriformis]|nr:hypothetical protein G9A89_005592 [Geosiphon pyriformis]